MEVLYRSNYEGGATCTAYLEDGYDAGPTLFREDPDAPGFYLTFQNPMWHEVKPQIIQFSDFLNWYEPIDYKATLNWLLYKKEVSVGRFAQYRYTNIGYTVTDVRIKSTYMTRIDETSFCHDVIVIADLVAHLVGRSRPVTECEPMLSALYDPSGV